MAGITENGFETKRLPDVLDSLRTKAKDNFGQNINTDPDSVMGQLIDTVGAEIATLWQTAEAAYASRDPAAAEGVLLDVLSYIIGINRKSPTKGSVVLSPLVAGDDGITTIPSGSVFVESTTGLRYTSTASITPVSTACTFFVFASSISDFSLHAGEDAIITIDGVANVFEIPVACTQAQFTAGVIAAVKAQTGSHNWTAVDFFGWPAAYSTDNNTVTATINGVTTEVIIAFVGSSVNALAEDYDTRTISPLSTFNLVNPITGVSTALNLLASVPGTDTETDVELRLRRQESLATAGASTLESIVSKVRGLSGVTAAVGYENTTNATDSYSRPAKSFEIVVVGGDSTDIATTISEWKPAGIETTYGNATTGATTVQVPDLNGVDKPINFSIAQPQYVHIRAEYKLYNEERFLETGAQGIKDALYNFGVSGEYRINKDIIPQRLLGDIYDSVSGISSVSFRLDTTAAPATTPTYVTDTIVTMDIRDYAVFVRDLIIIAHAFDNTVTTSNSSAVVTINSADSSKVVAGDIVFFDDETTEYTVLSVDSSTQITLTSNRPGSGQGAGKKLCVKKDTV
jgi:uncharacterized phage protein gp47/JayE